MSKVSKFRLSYDIISLGLNTNCVCKDKTRVKGHVDILCTLNKERKNAKFVSVNFAVFVRAFYRNILLLLSLYFIRFYKHWQKSLGEYHSVKITLVSLYAN